MLGTFIMIGSHAIGDSDLFGVGAVMCVVGLLCLVDLTTAAAGKKARRPDDADA